MFKNISVDKIIASITKPFKSKNRRRFDAFMNLVTECQVPSLNGFTDEEIEKYTLMPCDMTHITALHIAAWQECNEVLEDLLKHCNDVDVADYNGTTPLMIALSQCDAAKVKLLIEHGADPNLHHFDGVTAVVDVINSENSELLDYLLDNGCDPNLAAVYESVCLLHVACGIGSVPIIRSLCTHGAKLDTFDCYGQCPIHIVAAQDYLDAIQYLVSIGDDINRLDQAGSTPLAYARQCGATKVEKYLMTLGGNDYAEVSETPVENSVPSDSAPESEPTTTDDNIDSTV